VVIDLLNGIIHLHKHNVVHRDLKPGNILVFKRGEKVIPVITDFGLSKQTEKEGQSRFSNSFGGGTLKYSSPEQLKAEKLRLNTDLWAYGVIVHLRVRTCLWLRTLREPLQKQKKKSTSKS
jgi:serine/threonine protein kinase